VLPPCSNTPASTLLSGSVDSSTGILTATWTRPLAPGDGHYAIQNGYTFLIAASASAAAPTPTSYCSVTSAAVPTHDMHVEKIPLNFFLAPPTF
jgi:hypothetical protein